MTESLLAPAPYELSTHIGQTACFFPDYTNFDQATFLGETHFGGTTFIGDARFEDATFRSSVEFGGYLK